MNRSLATKVTRRPESAQALEDYLAAFHERHGRLPTDAEMDGVLRYIARSTFPFHRACDAFATVLLWLIVITTFVVVPCIAQWQYMNRAHPEKHRNNEVPQ